MRFFKRKYSGEKAFQLAKEILQSKQNVNKHKDINLLRKYLTDSMIKNEVISAVDNAFDEIFSRFDENEAFFIAIYILNNYSIINRNRIKDEDKLKTVLSSNLNYVEIKSRVDNLYKSYYSRFSKEDALELGKPFIKHLGPVESDKKLDKLISYYYDEMSLSDIKEATKKAYLNEFGKMQGIIGFRKRKIENPNAQINIPKSGTKINDSIMNKIMDIVDVGISFGADYLNDKLK